MSFVSELQRRNVFRVGLAYLAAAWLLIQVADTLFPAFRFPDSAMRITVVVLAVGLVPVLILAWVFELTHEGIRLESDLDRAGSGAPTTSDKLDRLIIIVLALAVAYFAIDKFVFSELRIESARQQGRSEALVESYGDKSIVVLPFEDMSAGRDQEYMSEGIAEELMNLLAKVRELRVTSRSSAFAFKGRNLPVPDIAEKLNVSYVLEGSVRKAGQTLRITAQLIEARSDTHLWSQTYDRELTDIFNIQDQIAEAVVDQLKVQLLGDAPSSRETDPEAYALFLQARHLHEQPARGSFLRAMDLYKAALAIDDTYVPAWVWLAALYDDTANAIGLPYDEVGRLARAAIDRALAIDPDDPMALGMSGIIIEAWEHDLDVAAARMNRALELDPTNPILLRWAALLLPALGRYDDAVRINEYLFERDPVGNIAKLNLAGSYINAGEFDKSIELCGIQVALNPGDGPCRYRLVYAHLYQGETDAAIEDFEALTSENARQRLAPMVYHAAGRTDAADAAIMALRERYLSGERRAANRIAQAYSFSGEIDEAFEWLDRAIADDVFSVSPDSIHFRNLHDDPRWDALMKQAGQSDSELASIQLDIRLPR